MIKINERHKGGGGGGAIRCNMWMCGSNLSATRQFDKLANFVYNIYAIACVPSDGLNAQTTIPARSHPSTGDVFLLITFPPREPPLNDRLFHIFLSFFLPPTCLFLPLQEAVTRN